MKDRPKFAFKKIRTKLLALTLGVLILSLSIILTISSFSTYNSTMKTLESTLSETASVASGEISAQLNGNANLVHEMSNNIEISTTQPQSQVIDAMNQMAKDNNYKFLRRTDATGTTYGGDVNISDSEYFQACKNTEKPYVSDPFVTADTKERVFIIASPIIKDGVFEGVLLAGIDNLMLSEFVKQIVVGETGTAYLINKAGTTIAAYDEKIVDNEENAVELAKTDDTLKDVATIEAKMAAGESGFGESRYNGNVELTSYAPVAGTNGWSFAVTVAKSEFFKATYQSLVLCLGISFLVFLVAAFIFIRFASSLSKPITAINSEMLEFGKGNFSSEFWIKPDATEIGQLAESIMLSKNNLKEIIDDTALSCKEMAQGNFDISSNVKYLGDFEEIETALNQITISLSDTLGQINVAAEQVSFGSDQVSSGAQALAQGSTEQAGTSEELSSSISMVSDQVAENAANAVQANENLVTLGQEILKSNVQMQQLTEAMSEINISSKKIEKIIKTIEDIAFQTNILALNAAVEAARAGTAGKGFAVVADEVRNLASKSAEAAKDTTSLIESSILAVRNGTDIADQTEQSLASVVSDAEAATLTVEKITKASKEQAIALNQITQGMEQISSVVQSNSATSEESAAAAEELSGQAQMLKDLVSHFKLKNTNGMNFASNQASNFTESIDSANSSFDTFDRFDSSDIGDKY